MPQQQGLGPAAAGIQAQASGSLEPWEKGQPITAARLQRMTDAIAGIERRNAPPNIVQGRGVQNRPVVIYAADDTYEKTDTHMKATRIGGSGEILDAAEWFQKGLWYRVNRGDLCTFIVQMTGEAVLFPVDPVRRLVFQQGAGSDGESLDMPDNTKAFEATHVDQDYRVIGCHIYATAGTYSVQLTKNGTAQADTLTEGSGYPYEITSPYEVEYGDALGLKVNSSSGVKGFEAVFFLRRGCIVTIP